MALSQSLLTPVNIFLSNLVDTQTAANTTSLTAVIMYDVGVEYLITCIYVYNGLLQTLLFPMYTLGATNYAYIRTRLLPTHLHS